MDNFDFNVWPIYSESLRKLGSLIDSAKGDEGVYFIVEDDREDFGVMLVRDAPTSGWCHGTVQPSAFDDEDMVFVGTNEAYSDNGRTSDECRQIAVILEGLTKICDASAAFPNIYLGPKVEILWDEDVIGHAVDEIGGVYAFQAKSL